MTLSSPHWVAPDDGRGTVDEPAVFYGLPYETAMGRWAEIYESFDHVHLADGRCAKNRFAEKCPDPGPPPIEDRNQLQEWLDAL